MPMRHWRESELDDLKTVQSFGDITEIALPVLRRVYADAQNKGKIVSQVCGPISTGGLGCIKRNTVVFQTTIQVLLCRGFVVFNQMPLQDAMSSVYEKWRRENPEGYCQPILDEIYAPLFETRLIGQGCFIPKWHTSTGTKWEREKLFSLRIDIYDIPIEWILHTIPKSL